MAHRSSTSASSALAVVLLVAAPGLARADDPPHVDSAAAEVLFREARALMSAKRYAQACPKLEESQRLDPGAGTLLNLGLCHEQIGKLATAWAELDQVVTASRESKPERAAIAAEHLQAIQPRLPRLAIIVEAPSRDPGLVVRLDGQPHGEAVWGTRVPIDPGSHHVSAEAPNRKPWSLVVVAAEGQLVEARVPPLEPAPARATGAIPPRDSAVGLGDDEGRGGRATIGWVVGGVGLAAVGVGAYFGVRAIGLWSDANGACPHASCNDPSAVDKSKSAGTAAIVADIAVGVGLAAVAAGLVIVFTSSPGGKATAGLRAGPSVVTRGGGVALSGAF